MSLAVKSARVASQGGRSGVVRSGDPGLFGFLGGVAKTAASFVTGGPAAAIGTAVSSIRGRAPSSPTVSRAGIATPTFVPRPGVPTFAPPSSMRAPPSRSQAVVPFQAAVPAVGGCPAGHHPNKSSYFLMDGTFVEKGSRCVKNRRRNPLNPRAASRAISRIVSAKKATASLSRVSVRKKKC